MTRGSIREYTEGVRGRYLQAPKKDKGKILDGFSKVTGYQTQGSDSPAPPRKPARESKDYRHPRRYGSAAVQALKLAWDATDRLRSKRLHPFLPD